MSVTERDERIRARAYEIWEDEGRPDGAEERHWQQATAEVTEDVGKFPESPQNPDLGCDPDAPEPPVANLPTEEESR